MPARTPKLRPWLALLLSVLLASPALAQSIRLESIQPAATDPAITGWTSSHSTALDVAPTAEHRNQLFLYLHGQGGTGAGASELLKTAAESGYHAIGLTYANDWSPFNLCSGNPDTACAENIRREIIEGADHSPLIAVSRANSIENRLLKLLAHLHTLHPTEGWNQFTDPAGAIRWNLICVWGHSQGGGNAGVLARHHVLARCCTSAPAADGGASAPAPWWATHATPSSAYFGFCHSQDALAAKVAFWDALGLAPFGPVIDVATASSPYSATHKLSSSVAPAIAGQYHNSVVADSVTPRGPPPNNIPVYKPVWQYMITAPTDNVSSGAPSRNDQIFATVPTFTGATDLKMDIHGALAGSGPRPVLIWIHGGGWQSGSHDQTPAFALSLRERGITVASIGYRLTHEAVFPAQIHDCKGAIRWLRAHAAELQIDPARIGVWGSSAGGHLAALVATSGNNPALEGTIGGNTTFASSVIAGAIYFGPTDILQMQPDCALVAGGCSFDHDAFDSPESKLLGVSAPGQGLAWLRANLTNSDPPFPEKSALAAASNPITHLDPADPPLFIAHGDIDRVVPLNQGARLQSAAAAAGVPVQFEIAEGFGHGSVGAALNEAVADWMADQLLAPAPCASNCTADTDCSRSVTATDIFLFLDAWFAQNGQVAPNLSADFNNSGAVDATDIFIFLDAWFAQNGQAC